jgi:microcystin-dependent protein
MSDYARVHNFSVKDGLSTGNPLKVIKGSEVDAEFDALVTHVATKIDEPAAPSEGDLLVYTSGVWTATSNALVPSGAITAYGGSAAPTGWLNCNGASISTTTYADLFAVVGYTYGGAGANFNLPDLTGRVVAGLEASATRLTTGGSGINGATRGATGGTETHTLTTSEMPAHTHTNSMVNSGVDSENAPAQNIYEPGGGGTATGSTGGGNAHQNVQPTIVLMYIIKE